MVPESQAFSEQRAVRHVTAILKHAFSPPPFISASVCVHVKLSEQIT